ncbi:tetratricopeptide repeat protein [Patescibacteria group bacterium]|nr:tetratricopeptide repeat protein [Patescibacteria group bacterium]
MKLLIKNKKIYLILSLLLIALLAIAAIFFSFNKRQFSNEPEYFLEVNLPPEKIQELEERKAKDFEMLELFPNQYEVYMDLGNIERELGNASKAIEYFAKAWEIIPANSSPWLNIGNIYIKLGLYEDAEEAFLKAVDINNVYFFTYYNLTKLYQNYLTEKSDKIKSVYLEGLKNTNNDYQLLQPFTDYLIETGNYSEALKYLQVLLGKIPLENKQDVLERMEYVESLLDQNTQ